MPKLGNIKFSDYDSDDDSSDDDFLDNDGLGRLVIAEVFILILMEVSNTADTDEFNCNSSSSSSEELSLNIKLLVNWPILLFLTISSFNFLTYDKFFVKYCIVFLSTSSFFHFLYKISEVFNKITILLNSEIDGTLLFYGFLSKYYYWLCALVIWKLVSYIKDFELFF